MKFKSDYNNCSMFCMFGFWFWLVETLLFLVIYGWHWQPINEYEKICDVISIILMYIGIYFFFRALWRIVRLCKEIEEDEDITRFLHERK